MVFEAKIAGDKLAHPGDAARVRLTPLPGAINRPSPIAIETRKSSELSAVVGQYWLRLRTYCIAGLREEAEFGHLFYWSPVLLGAGAATWFALPQPWPLQGIALVLVLSLVLVFFAGHFRPIARTIGLVGSLLAAGALLAVVQSFRTETIVLDTPVTTTIRGIVRGKEADAEGRWRYEIRLLETQKPALKRQPLAIKVTALGKHEPFALGAGIEGLARLSPPSGPALAGLNDFAFDAYFDGTGAFGFFYGKPNAWSPPSDKAAERGMMVEIGEILETVRNHVGQRIRTVLPGDTGAFASSMVTDDRRAISKETTEALRLAGLAHIIAISGLNMALAAGIFFVGLRLLLSLSQELSHRLPVKKIAAGGALITVTLYYLISGFAVSAERAYIMMAIMLTAVFFGRPSISLRNVALSALIILVLSPSAVMGPGFQMSYAATLALVAGYSAFQRRTNRPGWLAGINFLKPFVPAWKFVAGIFMTSLIGGLSTALFSIEHFHRIAAWGLPANLLAMPVISFIVMPFGLLALMAMPFGMDWLPLKVMGFGLDVTISVAKWAASLGGDVVVGRIPPWLFIGLTAALIILAVMRSRLRFLGVAIGAGLLTVSFVLPASRPPDIIVFEDGSLVGIRTAGQLAISKARPSSAARGTAAPQTRLDTGFPGRPSTCVSPKLPTISGLPGRMAMRQKSSSMPTPSSVACTRSWSPTEAPPSVTMTSAFASRAARRRRDRRGVVGDDAEIQHIGAGLAGKSGDAEGAGSDDLRRSRRAARRAPARRRWRAAPRAACADRERSRGSWRRQPSGAKNRGSCRPVQHGFALEEILSARTDVLALDARKGRAMPPSILIASSCSSTLSAPAGTGAPVKMRTVRPRRTPSKAWPCPRRSRSALRSEPGSARSSPRAA
jgi:competence protein ComEC